VYFVNGSTVLPNKSVGKHRVTVFRGGNDSFGNWDIFGSPASVDFIIEPEPFQTTTLAPAIGILIATVSLAVSVLILHKRRKSKTA
jgi:hypothetical protein